MPFPLIVLGIKFCFLLLVDIFELVVVSQLTQEQLHGTIQFTTFGVVGLKHPVHTFVLQQGCGILLFIRVIDRNGVAAGLLHQLHTRHVGQTVANIDHIAEEHPLFAIGTGIIQILIVVDVQHALVDTVTNWVLLV